MSKQDDKKQEVTEEELLKSLEALEGKKDEKAKEKDSQVSTAKLEKTADQRVADDKELKEALIQSLPLQKFAETMGVHVDASLVALQKSVEQGAQRDMVMIKVLEKMAGEIVKLQEVVEKFGAQPLGGKSVTTQDGGKVLEKTSEKGKPEYTKKDIMRSLEDLAKSAEKGSSEQKQLTGAAVKYESTSEISDEFLAKAIKNLKK